MFEENENLVEEETTENVEEQTTEENVQDVQEESTDSVENTEEKVEKEQEAITFTKEQVDEMIAKKLARKEAKIRREYEKKYGRAETVLKTGLQKDNLEDAVSELENYYEEQGVRIPKIQYSERDTEILARAEADEIIDSGYDDIVEEVDRLANIGVENMSASDKIMFQKLAEARMKIEEERDLSSLGISKDSLSEEFKEFAKHLDSKMSLKDKYEFYQKYKPKKEVRKLGSMESGPINKVKDYYTAEEIDRLTDEDLDNDAIWNAVRKSMTGQNK